MLPPFWGPALTARRRRGRRDVAGVLDVRQRAPRRPVVSGGPLASHHNGPTQRAPEAPRRAEVEFHRPPETGARSEVHGRRSAGDWRDRRAREGEWPCAPGGPGEGMARTMMASKDPLVDALVFARDVGSYNTGTSYQQPTELAHFSRDEDGAVHFDDRCLRRFRRSVLSKSGHDLNVGFENFKEKTDDSERGFGNLLECLRRSQYPLENICFVTFRNNLNKVTLKAMLAVLTLLHLFVFVAQSSVHTLYAPGILNFKFHAASNCLKEIPASSSAMVIRQAVLTQQELMQQFFLFDSTYYGYSFEALATEERRHPAGTAVNANVEYCALMKTKLGAHRIILGAEMDCYERGEDGARRYIELKTSREVPAHGEASFERNKLLRFWVQSYLAGVPIIVCGFRDDNGHLLRVEELPLKAIAERVKVKKQWLPGVCLGFADKVLNWLYGSVAEDSNFLLRFRSNLDRLELLPLDSCPEMISSHVLMLKKS
eukprot:SM000108S14206  [mRNA]  locus=s108:121131:124967:- [translate_table: standard]